MRVKVSDLTIEQKIKLLAGKTCWSTNDLDGKLYEVIMSDGPLGLRKCVLGEDGKYHDLPSVAYPSTQVLAQTWNTDLAYKTGSCLADDCIDNNVDVLLAPGVNIKRSPMCGRNFEYFSEDPVVAGTLAERYIRGLQDKHVGTALKHFCANNIEVGREWISSEVDERTLREIYTKAFEIACQADPWCVMTSYNPVNGVRMSQNAKMNKLLREKIWKRNGMIVSDWCAVKDHTAAVKSGCDLEMPDSELGYKNLVEGYEKGEVSEAEIDACVERVLQFVQRCEAESILRKTETTVEQRSLAALEVARQGIVLLKNNGVLPIANGQNVSVACEHGDAYFCGNGSSRVTLKKPQPLIDQTLKECLPDSEVKLLGIWDLEHETFRDVFNNAYYSDVAVVVCGMNDQEGDDRTASMRLNEKEENIILQTALQNPNTVVVLHCGAAVDMSPWIDKVAAVVSAGYTGEQGNKAIAEILSGKVNPSGKLTETFAKHRSSYPSEHTFRNHMVSVYSEGLDVGYRYFDRNPQDVVFPFGFGLSYSSFEISDLAVTACSDGFDVSVKVANTSDTDGAEVVQVYVSEPHAVVYRPLKELKAFAKVFVAAGKTEQVTLRLDRNAFAYYSVSYDDWVVNPGPFQILVGNSSANTPLKKRLEIK